MGPLCVFQDSLYKGWFDNTESKINPLKLQRISVILHADQKIWRGCSDAPVMHIEICAIGAVESREQNQKNTEKIFEFIQEKTGLPLDRYMFIEYPTELYYQYPLSTGSLSCFILYKNTRSDLTDHSFFEHTTFIEHFYRGF
jgi:hypothetical protein